MKINPTELQQIIKEEALRLKKRMMLEGEKKAILKKLQEMEEGAVNEIFGFSAQEQFEKAKTNFIAVYTKKGVPAPSEQDLQAIEAAAATDKYQGAMGLTDPKNLPASKFSYRPSNTMKFKNQFGGGGTGGNPQGGTAGA